MLQRMVAEIIFLEPDDVHPAIAELTELGFDCEVLHWIEPDSDAMWILARIDTELDMEASRMGGTDRRRDRR